MILKPMLANIAGEGVRLVDPLCSYERKEDGVRAIVETGGIGSGLPHIFSRDGNDKTKQFPEVAKALGEMGLPVNTILDGEIVAVNDAGDIIEFQELQTRVHLQNQAKAMVNVALVVFDLLQLRGENLCAKPLGHRRMRMNGFAWNDTVRCSSLAMGDGRAMYEQAKREGWEGLMVKRINSPYRPGKRSDDWLKLKFCLRQEFVVVGWTEPQGSRQHLGALILAVNTDKGLEYVGSAGTGFTETQLKAIISGLEQLERGSRPLVAEPSRKLHKPHWCEPKYLCEAKFNAWTREGHLRHPVFLGLRDDKDWREVRREA